MRKFLVVLLVLSIMGGAFAQDEEAANKWGNLTGEAGLSSRIAFGGMRGGIFDGGTNANNSLMDGKDDAVWLKITYSNTIGPWALSVPLIVKPDFFGIEEGAVSYSGIDNLTVSLDFGFKFNKDSDTYYGEAEAVGIIPMAYKSNLNVLAVYETDTYGFTFGVNNLIGSWDDDDKWGANEIGLGKVGGFYKFMDGRSQLYVSINEAYPTEWWRASSLVTTTRFVNDNINADLSGDNNNGQGNGLKDPLRKVSDVSIFRKVYENRTPRPLQFHWENIKDNGIAYRFYIVPEVLDIGVAMIGGDAPFKNDDSRDDDGYFDQKRDKNIFLDDFLAHPVIGISFNKEDLLEGLAVSTMIGFEPSRYKSGYNGDDKLNINNRNPETVGGLGGYTTTDIRNSDIFWAFGSSVGIIEGLTFGFDLSSKFYGTKGPSYSDEYAADGTTYIGRKTTVRDTTVTPIFNLGFDVKFDKDLDEAKTNNLNASASFKTFDMLQEDIFAFGVDMAAGFAHKFENESKLSFGLTSHIYGFNNNNRFDDKTSYEKSKRKEGDLLLVGDVYAANAAGFDTSIIKVMETGFGLDIGFTGIKLGGEKQFTFGVTTSLTLDILTFNEDFYNDVYATKNDTNGKKDKLTEPDYVKLDPTQLTLKFNVKPTLDWAVHANGTISFGYEFGVESINFINPEPINKNDVTVAFKWSF